MPASSVKEINVGSNLVPAMLSGRVDATLGAFWNYEAIQLAQLHKHPNVIHVEDVGVPTYDELVVVVRKNTIVNHPDVVRRFVQALGAGLRVGPERSAGGRRQPGPRQLRARSEAPAGQRARRRCRRSSRAIPSDPWGWQNPAQWNAYGQWMLSNHLISDPNAVLDASTNELLAGQGL